MMFIKGFYFSLLNISLSSDMNPWFYFFFQWKFLFNIWKSADDQSEDKNIEW